MKYLFILGRNPELSVEEVKSYLERKGNVLNNSSLEENGFLVDVSKQLESNAIDKLGGVVAIGEVLCDIDKMDDEMIYYGNENNFNYVLWDYSKKTSKVSEYLKKRFRSEKLKATEKNLTGFIQLQDGKKVKTLNSNLVKEQYFVFDNFFGRIFEFCDYESIEKRDIEKPVRREELAISPRLAKIMINLSQVKEQGKLADAFCGIGVVLQEALLQGIKVVGIDRDKDAIHGSKKNLEWFKFSKDNYKLINFDSRRVKIPNVDVMVSEPDLGETLKKIPTKEKAQKQLEGFEDLMIKVLNNMKKYVSKRFVFTAPLIRIGKKRLGCNSDSILESTGLKLEKGFPIKEFRENQIVGREIFVLKYK